MEYVASGNENYSIPTIYSNGCIYLDLSQDPSYDSTIKKLYTQTLEKLGDEHDQIPKLYAYFVENNDFYLVQEYIEGSDLTREIGSALYTKTPPTIRISELQNNSSANKESISRFRQQWEQNDVIKLLKEILTILEYVHQQGIIHRDIKPANLIRRKNDNKIVLIDFGCVKEVSNTIVNNQGQTVYNMRTRIGTVGYCPPE